MSTAHPILFAQLALIRRLTTLTVGAVFSLAEDAFTTQQANAVARQTCAVIKARQTC